jgi:hypothetical protein
LKVVNAPVPPRAYVFENTGTSEPAAYPIVSTIDDVPGIIAFCAVVTRSENVVQWAESLGRPPLKW